MSKTRRSPRKQFGGAVLPGTVVGTFLGGDEDAVATLVGADRLEEVLRSREGGTYEPEESLVSTGAAERP